MFFEATIEFNHIEFVNLHMDRIQFNFVYVCVNVLLKKCKHFVHPVPRFCMFFKKNENEKNKEIGGKVRV